MILLVKNRKNGVFLHELKKEIALAENGTGFFHEIFNRFKPPVVIFDYLNEFFDFYGNFLLTFAEKSCIMVGSLVQMK